MNYFRVAFRLTRFICAMLYAGLDYWVRIWPNGSSLRARTAWGQKHGQSFIKSLDVKVVQVGTPPKRGLMVSNHLSYLDVPVYYSTQPQVFLSKAEVRNWPLIGWLTWCAGTLYIRRDRRTEVGKVREQFEEVLQQGLVISLFPEGTSSDGSKVLPFHSSLLEPAVGDDRVITPAWIKYEIEGGDPAQDVCYWGDMVFGPHFLKLLSKGRITTTMVFGEPISGAGLNRKDLARILQEKVEELSKRPIPAA